MSFNLYMEPVKPPEAENLGGVPFKSFMCRAFGEHDGSLREDFLLGTDHLPTLEVLLRMEERRRGDAIPSEVEVGLVRVIAAIQQHGLVRLYVDE